LEKLIRMVLIAKDHHGRDKSKPEQSQSQVESSRPCLAVGTPPANDTSDSEGDQADCTTGDNNLTHPGRYRHQVICLDVQAFVAKPHDAETERFVCPGIDVP